MPASTGIGPLHIEHVDGRPTGVTRRRCLLLRMPATGTPPRAYVRARVSIGSSPSADFVVDAPDVAPVHAVVVRTDGGYRILDTGSDGGTHVDGVRVGTADLHPGATLRLGSAQITFDQDRERLALDGVGVAPFDHALEVAAATEAAVLLDGADPWPAIRLLHRLSPRRSRPLVACDGPTTTAGLLFGEGGAGLLALSATGTLVLQNGARLDADLGIRLRDALSSSGHDVRLIVTHSGPRPSSEHPLLAWVAPARLVVPAPEGPPVEVAGTEAFKDAKERWVDRFERRYLERCLQDADGNLSRAARAAGLDRKYLRRLLQKHGLRDRSASGISQEAAYPEGSTPRRIE